MKKNHVDALEILPPYGRLNDKMKWMISVLFTLLFFPSSAQQTVKLNLKETIGLANDSSLSAFRYQNMYLSGYWEYRTYKANRLPSLALNLVPALTNRGYSREEAEARLAAQMPVAEKAEKSHYVIYNDAAASDLHEETVKFASWLKKKVQH